MAEGPSDALEPFVGTWHLTTSLTAGMPEPPRAWTSFEWMTGRKFLVQRWEVEVPEAPDGMAVIGFDEEVGRFRQHYFDSRGVARIYEMTLEDGVWRLWRDAPGFSQRWEARFSGDGRAIAGTWEMSRDGTAWERDFDLTYTRAT